MEYTLIASRSRTDTAVRLSYAAKVLKYKKNIEPIVIFDKKISKECLDIHELFNIKKIYKYTKFLNLFENFLLLLISFLYFFPTIIYINFKGLNWFVDNFRFKEVLIGDLIYDRYIRTDFKYLSPKFYDLKFLKLFFFAIHKILILNKIFEKYKIKYSLIASKSYLSMSSLILRVSEKFRVKTVFIGGGIHKIYCKKDDFDDPSKNTIKKILKNINEKKLAKNSQTYFKNKVSGKLNSNTKKRERTYDEKYWSNFKKYPIFFKNLKKKKKIFRKVILFASHSFSENNHYTGSIIFRDYFQHFMETLEFAKKDKKNLWIFKLHPASKTKYDELDTSLKVLKSNLRPNIIMSPLRFSNKILFKHVDMIVSTRGTINIEAACHGIANIITADSYFSDFGFSKKIETKKKYFNFLKNEKNFRNLSAKQIKKAKEVLYIKKNLIGEDENNIVSRKLTSKKDYMQKIKKFLKKGDKKLEINYKNIINDLIK